MLDTQTLLWWWESNRDRLSSAAAEAIEGGNNAVIVSAVNGWEIATRHRAGKLTVPGEAGTLAAMLADEGFALLPVLFDHAVRAGQFAAAHRDPFDRLLAAQAVLDDLILVTRDAAFAAFPCRTLW